jgi:hypothetical protein
MLQPRTRVASAAREPQSTAVRVDPGTTLRRARDAYFEAEGLPPDGGYGERWVRTRVGPFPFAYPNTEGRRRLAPLHDLHHVATGYATDIAGEAEVGAWELGTGMRDRTGVHLASLVLGFALPRCPRRLYRAFVRGRHSRNLLDRRCDDALLARTVGDVRRELGLDREIPPPTAADRRRFAFWAARAALLVWGPLVPMAALAWWWWR